MRSFFMRNIFENMQSVVQVTKPFEVPNEFIITTSINLLTHSLHYQINHKSQHIMAFMHNVREKYRVSASFYAESKLLVLYVCCMINRKLFMALGNFGMFWPISKYFFLLKLSCDQQMNHSLWNNLAELSCFVLWRKVVKFVRWMQTER